MKHVLPKRPSRLHLGALLILILSIAIVPTYFLLHTNNLSHAHAAASSSTPTFSMGATTVRPIEGVSVTAQGFTPFSSAYIYVDSTTSPSIGFFICDFSGNCNGEVIIPPKNILQGRHTFLAVDGSLQAQTTAIVLPAVQVRNSNYNYSGGPGSALQVNGAGFKASETIQVYWGSVNGTALGTTTTDSQGNLVYAFNAPANAAPAHYRIYFVRTQKPTTVIGAFRILPPRLQVGVATAHGAGAIYVSVQGYQANEQVSVSWNANGGQTLGTFSADATGAGTFASNPVSVPKGGYTVTVTGLSSAISLTHKVQSSPGISLTSSGPLLPGAPVTITGGGFLANESLLVYIQNNRSAAVPVTADATGAFTTQLALPSFYKTPPNSVYGEFLYAYAADQQNHIRASTSFTMAQIELYTPDFYSIVYGQPITFDGFGFAANASINLYWDYQGPGQQLAGTATTDSSGNFIVTFPAPSAPYLQGLGVPIEAIDAHSHLRIGTGVMQTPALILNPPTGVAGTILKVSGGNFDGGEVVTLTFNGVTIATPRTDRTGAFTAAYTLPAPTGQGIVKVTASGGTSGLSLSDTFLYTPLLRLTPTHGVAGTTVTLIGTYFSRSSVNVSLVDPTTNNSFSLGTVYPGADGTFLGRASLPVNGLVNGTTYDVQAYDYIKNLTVEAPFVLQAPGAQTVQLSTPLTVPGASEMVSGTGFTPGETVNVYFQQGSNGTVQATADGQGNISAQLTLPVQQFSPKQTYYINAVSTTNSAHKARAQVVFAFPNVHDEGGGCYGEYPYLSTVYFVGSGFAAGEQVDLAWDYGSLGKIHVGTVTADSNGNFNTQTPFPSLPYGYQTLNFVAHGKTSGIVATAGGYQCVAGPPQVVVTPSSGSAGTTIQVQGGDFAQGEYVSVSANGQGIFSGFADKFGVFSVTYKVPASLGPGSLAILASGATSQKTASATFTVVPTLNVNPTTGTSSTLITVSGQGWTTSSTVDIQWFDPNSYANYDLGLVNTAADGSFSTTISPPETLTSGTTYTITVIDTTTGTSVLASFTAQ